ncbi:MAG: DUF3298 and DUF4163 domain-containing protein [Chlorobiaceae bacterium]|nr:DUF3298 and DUF4163 domain-containing protein [Chlorobiaceae bacterium]
MTKNSDFFCSAALLLSMLLVLSACSSKDSTKTPQPLSYEMKRIEKIYSNGETTEANKSWCKCRYPVFTDGKSADAINACLLNWIADSTAIAPGKGYTGNRSIEALADNFLRDYEKIKNEFPVNWPYEFELEGSVILNRSGLLSVELSNYSFTGGAHGSSHTEYFVFDTLAGNRLVPGDVFTEGFKEPLNKLIDSRYRKMKGLSSTDRLDGEKGMLFENIIHFNNNFAITDSGVSFLYNQYEIAAYAYGPTRIDLSYSDLSVILRPKFRSL